MSDQANSWTVGELDQMKLVYLSMKLGDTSGYVKYFTQSLREKVDRIGDPYASSSPQDEGPVVRAPPHHASGHPKQR